MQAVETITIHVVTDFAPNTAWVHTHGMAKFNYPELECYWSPVASCQEASELINQLAEYLINNKCAIRLGDVVNLPGGQTPVQLVERIEHEADDYEGNNVVRVQRVTSGHDGVHVFRDLIEINDSPASFHHRQAVSWHLQDRFFEAWMEYEKALQLDPTNVYALANAGYLLLHNGDVEGSISFFQRASELAPNYALPHNNLGNAYLNLGRAEEARTEYSKAVALDDSYAMPHRNLALVNYLLGQRADAIAEYRTYFKLAPADTKDAEARFNLGVTLEESGRVEEAAEEYEKAISDNPLFVKAHTNLGLIYLTRGEVEKAAGYFEQALRADDAWTLARYNLGLCYAARGEYEKAIAEFERVREIEPGLVPAVSNLGVMYTTVGRFDEASRVFEELVALHEGQPTLHFNLGIAYQGKGLSGEAACQFQKVIELEPQGSNRALRAAHELQSMPVSLDSSHA